ncbi:hypothetical protein NX801_22080 [Streptomyces sp. LP05-1]|uniref:Uncharacterized protein n=1 Tax=Streptomyces pyxinae TaxID=2970734 RepID=A0ABT2CLI7_9ACTN|nr:hypothetical protein [Streptomyces sp. LP05-1]MCS0638291.1 hypothetical protein [Streptomyces sp. LP05-1]
MSDAHPGPARPEDPVRPEAPARPDESAGPGAGAGHGGEPAAPAPLGVVREPTGQPWVDAALERLGAADHLPADGHPAVYEDVHRELRETLAALDARPQPAPPYDHRS